MYKVCKDKGYYSNITLINTETKASIIIGKAMPDIMAILREEAVISDTNSKWDFPVSNTAGKALAEIAMPIKKPIRKQQETQKSEQNDHSNNNSKNIDAYDVLLGLVSYK